MFLHDRRSSRMEFRDHHVLLDELDLVLYHSGRHKADHDLK